MSIKIKICITYVYNGHEVKIKWQRSSDYRQKCSFYWVKISVKKHENCYLVEGNNLCWRGMSLLDRGFFQVGGMSKFFDSGGDYPISPKQRKPCTMQFNSTGYESNLLYFYMCVIGKKMLASQFLLPQNVCLKTNMQCQHS